MRGRGAQRHGRAKRTFCSLASPDPPLSYVQISASESIVVKSYGQNSVAHPQRWLIWSKLENGFSRANFNDFFPKKEEIQEKEQEITLVCLDWSQNKKRIFFWSFEVCGVCEGSGGVKTLKWSRDPDRRNWCLRGLSTRSRSQDEPTPTL